MHADGLLAKEPFPLWGAVCGAFDAWRDGEAANTGPVVDVQHQGHAFAFRGVSLDRLPAVLVSGVDVEPPDAPIYVGSFDKACEYGGHPKLLLAYTYEGLEPTWRSLPLDAPPAVVQPIQRTSPHRYEHRGSLWLSRIDDPNPARREYELAYARCIPGDALDSLKAAFVYGTEGDVRWAAEEAAVRRPVAGQ